MRIQKRQGKERRDGNPSVSSTVGMRECVREKERQREREKDKLFFQLLSFSSKLSYLSSGLIKSNPIKSNPIPL